MEIMQSSGVSGLLIFYSPRLGGSALMIKEHFFINCTYDLSYKSNVSLAICLNCPLLAGVKKTANRRVVVSALCIWLAKPIYCL